MLEVDFENLERLPEGQRDRRRWPQYDAVVGFFTGVTGGIEIGLVIIHAGATYVNAGAIFDGSEFLNRDNVEVGLINGRTTVQNAYTTGQGIVPRSLVLSLTYGSSWLLAQGHPTQYS